MTRATTARAPRAAGKVKPAKTDHLSALGLLMEQAAMDAARLFDHGLALLVEQLGVDKAFMIRLTELGYEVTWWHLAKGNDPGALLRHPEDGFCPRVLDHPMRPLVIKDARLEQAWREHPACRKFGVRAYLGAPLWKGSRPIGILSAQDSRPKDFTRPEIALFLAVANLFSKTLEVELLKSELHQTRDALDLTSAVVQDSALESTESGVPNRHYLEIWLKANLYLARRRGECMTVVRWYQKPTPSAVKHIRHLASQLRGEDLLVDLGHGQWLLLLPRTAETGAGILLERMREWMGPLPMGATLWNPIWNPDHDDLEIRHALQRAESACAESQRVVDHPVWWNVPDPVQDQLAPAPHPW